MVSCEGLWRLGGFHSELGVGGCYGELWRTMEGGRLLR